MASFAQLPDELRRLLETVTVPFASTATKFLEAIPNPEQHFARACEILITLTTVNGPGGINGGAVAHATTGDWRPVEKNIGFRLNATFMLYWLYKEHDVHVNPFRSHFLESCEAEKGRNVSLEKERPEERLMRARCKMMLAILGGEGSKLSDLSAKEFFANFEHLRLGESTDLRTFVDVEDEFPPISAWARPDQHHSHHNNNNNNTHHHQQQRQQGGANGYHGNSRQRAAGTPSPAPIQRGQPVFAQNYPQNHPYSSSSSSSPLPSSSISSSANRNPAAFAEETTTVPNAIVATTTAAAEDVSVVEDALKNAHVRHLNASERSMLRANIETAAKIYKADDPEAYRRMLDLNFDILQSLTVEILKNNYNNNNNDNNNDQRRSQQQRPWGISSSSNTGKGIEKSNSNSSGSGSGSRQSLLDTVLPRLNLELRSFDLINHLAYRPALDEPRTNSSRNYPPTPQNDITKQPPVLTLEERTRLLHVFTSNCIRQLEVPYGDVDGIPVTTARRTNRGPDVGRKVKLLCMFITNLLTREIVSSQEMYFEMQDLYMGFTNFKEAKELWTNATGGRGVGVGMGIMGA
ncbi:hypothetical protein TWF730_002784 [Orbilia blumenaviensis]|uniref:CCR4-NOT transcription complex subunit 11 n=1 Tax=Orbilia blumenaviensis TaxID=1796055 RepID=A0AAV9UBH8_9PEZI